MSILLNGGNQIHFHRNRRSVFVIISVIGNRYQVGYPCQQEHQSQYSAAKTFMKNLPHIRFSESNLYSGALFTARAWLL